MGSAVVEKNFVWRFIDEVTSGVKQAKVAFQDAEAAAKKAGMEVSQDTNWQKYNDKVKSATQGVDESLNKSKSNAENYSDTVKREMSETTKSTEKLNDAVHKLPTEKTTNLKATVDDNKLKGFSRQVHDVPDKKSFLLFVKDRFTGQLNNAQKEVESTKRSFSTLKTVMAGTFVGGAVLGGIYAIGNGLKEAASAGMQFETEQQKMNQTWLTLTGNASKGKAMVDTINELSVKTGQSRDLVNELEQGFYHLHSRKNEADDMTKAMLNMGDAVGLTSEQMQQVEQDMVHGLATGKVTQGELNQIGMYFPMIDEAMAKHFHTTVAGMRKMASAGKITGKDLEEVFEQLGSGKYNKAADNMMKSMWGMERTIKSQTPALVGAFEKPFFDAKNPFYAAVSKWMLDPATQKGFQQAGQKLANSFNTVITTITNLHKAFEPLNKILLSVISGLASGVWKGFSATLQAISQAAETVSDWLSKLVGLIPGMGKGNGALKVTHDIFKGLGTVIGAILGPLVAVKGALIAIGATKNIIVGIGTAIKAVTGITKIWYAATKAMRTAQVLLDVALDANPIGLLIIAITALVASLVLAYKHIKPFRDAVNRLGESIKRVFTGKSSWDKAIANQFKALNKAFDRDGKAFQKKMQQFNKAIWNGFTGNAKWEKDISKSFSKTWNNLAKVAKKGSRNLAKTINKQNSSIAKSWNKTWNTIGKFTSNIWNGIKRSSSNGMSNVSKGISNGMNIIHRIWQAGWDTFANIFKSIWNGIKQAAANGMNGVIGIINAGIGAVNKVWSFFTGHGTGIGKLSKVHFAQGGIVHRHLSVINDGDGPDWKELVQTPDGQLFMSQERNWTGFLPEGSRVFNGQETKDIMNLAGIEHYATGGIVGASHYASGGIVGKALDWAEGALDNVTSWLGDKFEAMIRFLEHPLESTKDLLAKATNGLYNGLGHFGELGHGAIDKLTNPIANWFKRELDKLIAAMENGGVSPDLIRLAAAKMHVKVSGADIAHILNVIQHESGGRANAVNNWDSNAKAGNPSKGILQFTGTTFAHYAVPGYGNIMRPFDQLLALFNDVSWRSDLTLGGWGPTGGRRFATGGEVFGLTHAILGDNPEGHEFVLNPYAPNADSLLDRAFEATATSQGQPINSSSNGNSKLDRMIGLLAQLVDIVGDIDPEISIDGQKLTDHVNHNNAKLLARVKG